MMFKKLIEHNDDMRCLVEKGYAVSFDSNCLIVRDIPYLDNQRVLHWGAIVAKLVFVDEIRVVQDDHQIYFAGAVPHGLDGLPIPNLAGGPTQLVLNEEYSDVVVQRSFSNKPKKTDKFENFFEKIESYVGIISGPAIELHKVSPYTYRVSENVVLDSVFKFHDTLTSRAGIADLAKKFENDVIAIIGLGGTGSYVLDFLVKTRAKEIRVFDPDVFHVHTSYRSPGKVVPTEFGRKKVEVYKERYDNFRSSISFGDKFIDESSYEELEGVTFAFVCVDKGSSRSGIFDLLLSKKIPFIDVGMGLKRQNNLLNGMLRTTYFSDEYGEKTKDENLADLKDVEDNLYHANIQIGELNALNASLAIIKFKQIRGFYFDEAPAYHLLFEVGDCKIVRKSENEN